MVSERLLSSDTTMTTNVSRDNQDSTNLRALHFLSKIALGLVLNLLCLITVTIGRPKDSVPPAVKIQIANSFSGSLPTDIETPSDVRSRSAIHTTATALGDLAQPDSNPTVTAHPLMRSLNV
jgi:hypothetical protein